MTQDDPAAAARAVYDSPSNRYVEFVGTAISAATEGPIDRSLLAAFIESVGAGNDALVADVGCGPGRVAAALAAGGLGVVGIDISTAMLAEARRAHPNIDFMQACIEQLPLTNGALAGAVCWYSIIYTPPGKLNRAIAELTRVLERDGQLLVAFQTGDGQASHVADAYGTGLPLTSYRHKLIEVARRLEEAGFVIHATAERRAELRHEKGPQGFVFARNA